MYAYRTRFAKDIVAEFLPPLTRRLTKRDKVILYCPGMPGVPNAEAFLEFWAKKGFWVFTFRYRGSWESGGMFLRKSPEEDVRDVLRGLSRPVTEFFGKKKFHIRKNPLVYVFGSSFGGPAALLISRDSRVTKVVARSPVVDWSDHLKHGETIDWTEYFARVAFGMAYRFTKRDWDKQKNGTFYNPIAHAAEIDGRKVLIMHAEDDDVVRAGPVRKFAKLIGATLLMHRRGGHAPQEWFTRTPFARRIMKFLRENNVSSPCDY